MRDSIVAVAGRQSAADFFDNIDPQETLTLSMTMLELNDPLWNKLLTMFGNERVPTLLSTLAASWNDETARTLLWGELYHQRTCCGATYAAVPHLLKIAEPEENRHQRLEIALFLGLVTLDTAPQPGPGDQSEDGEVRALIVGPYAIEPVNTSDLEKMRSIMVEFYSALPAIRAVCERALLENLEHEEVVAYLLSGIAAAGGLIGIASLLNTGDEGWFRCSSCGWGYSFIRFDERIAVYADTPRGALHDDKGLSDIKDGAPSRADGFMTPITDDGVLDARVAALLALAKRAPSPAPARLLRLFAGSFVCSKCGVQGPMHCPW